jgi:hypothetical protein
VTLMAAVQGCHLDLTKSKGTKLSQTSRYGAGSHPLAHSVPP